MDIIGGQGPNRQPGSIQPNSSNPPTDQPQGVAFRSNPSVNADAAGLVSQGPSTDIASIADSLSQPVSSQTPDANNSQSAQPSPKKKKGGVIKKLLVGVLLLVLLAGAVAAGFFVGAAKGKSSGYNQGKQDALTQYQRQVVEEDDTPTDTPSTDLEIPDTIPNKLTLGDLVEPSYKDENLEGVIGRQISSSDGLVMMVTSIERNFKTDDANYKLASGKELIKVNFLLGNIAKDKAKDINSFNFRLINSKGAQLTPESIAKYENKFDTVKIDKKGQVTLAIVYAIDKNEKPLSFIRIQTYRITNQNREVTTKMSVVIDK